MKIARKIYKRKEIVILQKTFVGRQGLSKADIYREPNKNYFVAVAHGTCAPVGAEYQDTVSLVINFDCPELIKHIANKTYWVGIGISMDAIEYLQDHLDENDPTLDEWHHVLDEFENHPSDNDALLKYCNNWLEKREILA